MQVPGLPNAPPEGVPVLSLVTMPRRALPEESAQPTACAAYWLSDVARLVVTS